MLDLARKNESLSTLLGHMISFCYKTKRIFHSVHVCVWSWQNIRSF